MKRIVGFAIIAATSVAAYGEEVKTSKVAALNTAIDNLYGSVSIRQASYEAPTEKRDEKRTLLSVRPRLGTKLFDGKVDAFFEAPLWHASNTAHFEQRYILPEVDVTLLDDDYATIMPYFDAVMPKGGEILSSNIHAYLELHAKINGTPAGDLTPFVAVEPAMNFHDKAQTTTVDESSSSKNSGGLALTDTTDNSGNRTRTTNQQEPGTQVQYSAGVNYVPSVVKKLTVTAQALFTREYNPRYAIVEQSNGETKEEKTGYDTTDTTMNNLILSYKADDKVTVSNDFRYRLNGFYAETAHADIGGYQRIENRLVLTYKLF